MPVKNERMTCGRPCFSRSMKTLLLNLSMLLISSWLTSCSNQPDAPSLTLKSVEGTSIELNEQTPLTALFFFSVSNPVALGAFDRLPDKLDDTADAIAIAMHVDRPPNISIMQQRTLVPIVIDEANRITEAFGGIQLSPTLILVDKGKILLQQRGRLDYDAINTIIHKQQRAN